MKFDSKTQEVINHIVENAKALINPKKIILFGSRARGDNEERSDFDFAFEFAGKSSKNWSEFMVLVKENAPTLCKFDLVHLTKDLDKNFYSEIIDEGLVVYEKK